MSRGKKYGAGLIGALIAALHSADSPTAYLAAKHAIQDVPQGRPVPPHARGRLTEHYYVQREGGRQLVKSVREVEPRSNRPVPLHSIEYRQYANG